MVRTAFISPRRKAYPFIGPRKGEIHCEYRYPVGIRKAYRAKLGVPDGI